MEYESDILKRLIKTYGVVGNPRYISEIIKEFIVQGKERFPELFTYQSDWLAHIDEFGLNPSYTVSYTGQSIYAPNTLERPVKRAILKGQTLVNIFNNSLLFGGHHYILNSDGSITMDATGIFTECNFRLSSYVGKTVTIFIIFDENTIDVESYNLHLPIFGYKYSVKENRYLKKYVGVVEDGHLRFGLTPNATSGSMKFKFMAIEGNFLNQNIPYFEGMKSVRMPGLTTSNEDGTKTNILTVNEDVTLRSNGDICDELNLLTGQLTQRIGEDGVVLSQEVVKTVDLTILDQYGQNVKQLMSFNGGTHFTTSSQEGSLLPTISVDVVTDLEETLKVCSLEGNTM